MIQPLARRKSDAKPGKPQPSTGNCWEKRIGRSEAAFQRPMIQKKIRELVRYYMDCQEARNLPAIPGAVIMITEKRLRFSPVGKNPNLGMLEIPEETGILRCRRSAPIIGLSAQTEKEVEIDVPATPFYSWILARPSSFLSRLMPSTPGSIPPILFLWRDEGFTRTGIRHWLMTSFGENQ